MKRYFYVVYSFTGITGNTERFVKSNVCVTSSDGTFPSLNILWKEIGKTHRGITILNKPLVENIIELSEQDWIEFTANK